MTAITVQSNKIVSNEVKDNYALLEPLHRKNITDFLANPIHTCQVCLTELIQHTHEVQ